MRYQLEQIEDDPEFYHVIDTQTGDIVDVGAYESMMCVAEALNETEDE